MAERVRHDLQWHCRPTAGGSSCCVGTLWGYCRRCQKMGACNELCPAEPDERWNTEQWYEHWDEIEAAAAEARKDKDITPREIMLRIMGFEVDTDWSKSPQAAQVVLDAQMQKTIEYADEKTALARKVCAYVARYIRRNGYAPTIGMVLYTACTQRELDELVVAGLVEYVPIYEGGTPGIVQVTEAGAELAARVEDKTDG